MIFKYISAVANFADCSFSQPFTNPFSCKTFFAKPLNMDRTMIIYERHIHDKRTVRCDLLVNNLRIISRYLSRDDDMLIEYVY